jgi:endonuclease/exonuclease/phosphatase family metal-dependent hydrolase
VWADVLIGSDTVRVYTTHLESNRFDGKVPEVIEEDAPEEMSNSVLLGVVQHHQKFSIERLRQAQLIKRHQEKSPYKSIICGDFNETPQSYVFQVLADGMQDTFQEEGCGIASTFGERIPALRIDHMLVDPELEVLDHTISRSQFSDHYLIIADLGL